MGTFVFKGKKTWWKENHVVLSQCFQNIISVGDKSPERQDKS